MIRSRILGIGLENRAARRWFVVGFWATEAVALGVLFRFPMPPDVGHWASFLPLLLTLGVASNLPLVLGGFSVGGAVDFYEGDKFGNRSAHPNAAWKVWSWVCGVGWRRVAATPQGMEQVQRFMKAVKPVDEREAQLRDWAHHRAHRMLFWLMYLGAIAYIVVSAISLSLVARFGFVLLELLLVASMSLPQTLLLWSLPNLEAGREEAYAR